MKSTRKVAPSKMAFMRTSRSMGTAKQEKILVSVRKLEVGTQSEVKWSHTAFLNHKHLKFHAQIKNWSSPKHNFPMVLIEHSTTRIKGRTLLMFNDFSNWNLICYKVLSWVASRNWLTLNLQRISRICRNQIWHMYTVNASSKANFNSCKSLSYKTLTC